MLRYVFIIPILLIMIFSCADVSDSNSSSVDAKDWLLPKGEIFDGGPGKDGIPALLNPGKEIAASIGYVRDNDLVVLYKHNNQVYVYPHRILDWHEIINDDLGDKRIVVSYCPLTGSAVGFNGRIDMEGEDKKTTFGVSGLLYNNNLILYDRATDSYWSQMRSQCVAGPLIGQYPQTENLVETTFGTAKTLYPQARVVANNTGVYSAGRYDNYPYGDYRTNDSRLIFPVSNDDGRLKRKERVFGLINGKDQLAFRLDTFNNTQVFSVNGFDGSYVVAGSKSRNFIVAYERMLNGKVRSFKSVSGALPVIMEDNEGNGYDMFGEIVSGPEKFEKLTPVYSYMAYWFAWGTFYPDIEIYENLQ